MTVAAVVVLSLVAIPGLWKIGRLLMTWKHQRQVRQWQQALLSQYGRLELPCRVCGKDTVYSDDEGSVHVECREVA